MTVTGVTLVVSRRSTIRVFRKESVEGVGEVRNTETIGKGGKWREPKELQRDRNELWKRDRLEKVKGSS